MSRPSDRRPSPSPRPATGQRPNANADRRPGPAAARDSARRPGADRRPEQAADRRPGAASDRRPGSAGADRRPDSDRSPGGPVADPAPVARTNPHTGVPPERVSVFAVATPGLEPLVLAEVTRLGVANAQALPGGVAATATWPQVWAMNLHLRIATRVLVRVARFDTDGFESLYRGLSRVDWRAWLPGDADLQVKVASSGSELYHTDAVAERVVEQVGERLGGRGGAAVELFVRISGTAATISLNTSGVALHKRGWREQVAKAPLRETLAAALLVHSGWDHKAPLVDPFCGSGTIAIEAALAARRIPPGRNRHFACLDWPSFDEARWNRLLAGADADMLDRRPVIVGSDRDAGAIEAARANAERAGVGDVVSFEQRSISHLTRPSAKRGWLVTNPPYGQRLDGGNDLRNLFDRFSAVAGERFADWRLATIAPVDSAGVRIATDGEPVATTNGGIPVVLRAGTPA